MTNRKQRRAAAATTPVQKATGPDGECCRGCKYWYVPDTEKRSTLGQAACRRNPPVALVSSFSQVPGMQPNISSTFPSVLWFGWCGSHTPE